MASIETSIEVDVPVRVAYDQWTQMEEFPRFMEGIESVTQISDTVMRWKASIAGVTREWEAEITEQTPDQRIAWASTQGARNAGVVTFHKLDEGRCKVMLQLDFDPDDLAETIGDKLGFIRYRASGDLKRFKEMIEARGVETGAWRGEVDQTTT